jgi:multiple sugar transport system substrate-binding protein
MFPRDRQDLCPSRRTMLRLGTTALSSSVLAACAPGQSPAPAQEAKEVTISWVTDWSSGTRADWIKVALPKFTEENPKIRVRSDNWGSGLVGELALAGSAAGTLQDVMLGANDVYMTLVRAGGMQDITPMLKSLKVNMNDVIFVPSTIQFQGKQYGMPFQWATAAMMVNKTLFRQNGAPLPDDKTTYPQLLEALKRISRPNEKIYGIRNGSAWTAWMPTVWGYGGDRFTPDFKKTLLDQPASIEGLQDYADLYQRHEVAVPLDEKGGLPNTISFVNGNVAIDWASSPGPGTDRSIAGKFEWDIMYHPLGVKTGKRAVAVNDQANMPTASAVKNGVLEQAVKFAVWCALGKSAQDLVVEVGPNAMPVSKVVLNSPKYLAGPPPGVKAMVDMIPNYRDPAIFIGWNDWRDAVTNALIPAFNGKKSVREAAADATRAGDLVLAKIPK